MTKTSKPVTANRVAEYFGEFKAAAPQGQAGDLLLETTGGGVTSAYSTTAITTIQVGPSVAEFYNSHTQIMDMLTKIIAKPLPTRAPFCTFISTLAVSDVSVLKPIPVTVEPEEDGSFVASFFDAGVTSGGDTVRDAIWSLQQMIASSFSVLREMKDAQLGPKMRRERDILLEFLCPSPKTTPNAPPKS
jgi:predicted RNase H-like HicB family nuclease